MYILAIDQGTTGTTTVLFNKKGQIVGKSYREFKQIYPQLGWVEHDPEEIWLTVQDTINELDTLFPVPIKAIGITNQRETTIVWDKKTGKPIYHAIVWQCRRTADFCHSIRDHAPLIQQKTGLPCDPYFSASKIKWILDRHKGSNFDDLAFGTIDTWLIWKLTGGRIHATDYTNASRTMIFNIQEKKWDKELCTIMSIPQSILPTVKKSIDYFGTVETISSLKNVPILGVAGDQQAALFGQTCFNPGQMKNTYGTGCFVVMNRGDNHSISHNGLITTLAVDSTGGPCYALEGSIFIAGAAIQWLRDELGILKSAFDSEEAAYSVRDNGGVYLVPAFVGLGAPWWDASARGVIVGLTRGANKNHLIRAALEAMAYQTEDVLSAMHAETGMRPSNIYIDGGAGANNFCMQFQADISNISVLRPKVLESTALGAAFLAGLNAGVWKTCDDLNSMKEIDSHFKPTMNYLERKMLLDGWQRALRQVQIQ